MIDTKPMRGWPVGVLLPICAVAALVATSCGGGRLGRVKGASDGAPTVGVYKGRVAEGQQSRRFRLLLYAATPDRLHGEVVAPVGGPQLIIDGGGGSLSVAVVRERLAFVGSPSPEVLEQIIGVRVSLRELVEVLLTGRVDTESYRLTREPSDRRGLPDLLRLEAGTRSLDLTLKRLARLNESEENLGQGVPPDGFARRALDELSWEWFDEPTDGRP